MANTKRYLALVKEGLRRLRQKPQVGARKRCPGCHKFYLEQDFVVQFCVWCSEERIRNMVEKFRPLDTTKELFPKCAECGKDIVYHGFRLWDSLAKSHKMVCAECGEKQFDKDPQYKDTLWGYATARR